MSVKQSTVKDLFNAVAQSFANEDNDPDLSSYRLILDRDFLIQLVCRSCDSNNQINQPLCKVGSRDGICQQCREPLQPDTTCEISFDAELADQKLEVLGVPDYDIVKVTDGKEAYFVLLKDDAGCLTIS